MKKMAYLIFFISFFTGLRAEWRRIYKGDLLDRISVVAPNKGWAIKLVKREGLLEWDHFLLEWDGTNFANRFPLSNEVVIDLEATVEGAYLLFAPELDARTNNFLKTTVETSSLNAFIDQLRQVAPQLLPLLNEKLKKEREVPKALLEFAMSEEFQALDQKKVEQCFKAADDAERKAKARMKPSFVQPLKLFANNNWQSIKDKDISSDRLINFAVQNKNNIWSVKTKIAVPQQQPSKKVVVDKQGEVAQAVGMPAPNVGFVVQNINGTILGQPFLDRPYVAVGASGDLYVLEKKFELIKKRGKVSVEKVMSLLYKWDGSNWQKLSIPLDRDMQITYIAPSISEKILLIIENQKTNELTITLWDGKRLQVLAKVDNQIFAKPDETAKLMKLSFSASADPSVVWIQKDMLIFDKKSGNPPVQYTEIYEWTPDKIILPVIPNRPVRPIVNPQGMA